MSGPLTAEDTTYAKTTWSLLMCGKPKLIEITVGWMIAVLQKTLTHINAGAQENGESA